MSEGAHPDRCLHVLEGIDCGLDCLVSMTVSENGPFVKSKLFKHNHKLLGAGRNLALANIETFGLTPAVR